MDINIALFILTTFVCVLGIWFVIWSILDTKKIKPKGVPSKPTPPPPISEFKKYCIYYKEGSCLHDKAPKPFYGASMCILDFPKIIDKRIPKGCVLQVKSPPPPKSKRLGW